jgi:hypothetical protein
MSKQLSSTSFDRDTTFVSFTGDCGLMMKMMLMESFCGECDIGALPTIYCMPCTAAAHCGVSSKKCKQCYRYGPCPNWYDLVQEMGRVDRLLNAPRGSQCYRVFLNVNTFLMLWVRTQGEEDAALRDRYESQLYQVLRFLIISSKCYHEAIEEHFENPATYELRGPCLDNCTFCCGEHVDLSGAISKQHLMGALQANIFVRGSVPAKNLVTLLTDKRGKFRLRNSIWGKVVESGKVHGLVLMMLASGMLQLQLKSPRLLGQKNIKLDNVVVVLARRRVITEDSYIDTLAINDDEVWNHFHLKK